VYRGEGCRVLKSTVSVNGGKKHASRLNGRRFLPGLVASIKWGGINGGKSGGNGVLPPGGMVGGRDQNIRQSAQIYAQRLSGRKRCEVNTPETRYGEQRMAKKSAEDLGAKWEGASQDQNRTQ
jgi:hypothetical protein